MTLQAVKGTRDILPEDVPKWASVENTAHGLMARYGYREIRTPLFEATELFARGIGGETDIVSKEMYTFTDPGGESLTLRPEATAGIVRAVIEHNLVNEDPVLKVYELGPMFRRERPQKGRYRQFHQLDVEAFGTTAPSIDVEIIELAVRYLTLCGLGDFEVVLNSVGDAKCRPAYVQKLRNELRLNLAKLGPDSQRRTETNPLRVLDSKAPDEQELIASLPKISDALCAECHEHFAEVRRQLGLAGIPYRLEPRLVRGLDYYVRTTFEITSGALGAQNSVLGGGRYDGLVKQLGGPDVSGIGFALGLERLVMLLPPPSRPLARCDVFLAPLGPKALDIALELQRDLRAREVATLMSYDGRGLKSQMKLADKLHARFVAMLGEDELTRGEWTIRDMGNSQQLPKSQAETATYLIEQVNKARQNG